MFGLSMSHLLVIGIVLLLFGSRRLPELGESLGKGIRNFKKALEGKPELPGDASQTAQAPKSDAGTKPQA
jgi:sec-independent protein translocase protein TatA